MSARRIIVVGLLLAGGCTLHPGEEWNRTDGVGGSGVTGGSSTGTSTGEDATDQSPEGMCPSTSTLLSGTRAAGDVCTTPADCVSTCCDCGTGTQSWLAATCVAGRCVDSLTSCSRTNGKYCGSGGGVVIVAPPSSGGQCGTTGASTACEACIDASCCSESLACSTNASCLQLESCDAACAGEPTCRERCYDANGNGALVLQALDTCVANACGAACEP